MCLPAYQDGLDCRRLRIGAAGGRRLRPSDWTYVSDTGPRWTYDVQCAVLHRFNSRLPAGAGDRTSPQRLRLTN